MRLPPAPDPEIRCRQMPSAVAGVGRLDQPLQHVERRRLQPITSAEHGDEQLDGAQLTRAPVVDQARPLAGKPTSRAKARRPGGRFPARIRPIRNRQDGDP